MNLAQIHSPSMTFSWGGGEPRNHINPVALDWKFDTDDPEQILEESLRPLLGAACFFFLRVQVLNQNIWAYVPICEPLLGRHYILRSYLDLWD